MNFLNATEGGLVAHFHAPVRPENHEPFRRMKKKIIPFFLKGKIPFIPVNNYQIFHIKILIGLHLNSRQLVSSRGRA